MKIIYLYDVAVCLNVLTSSFFDGGQSLNEGAPSPNDEEKKRGTVKKKRKKSGKNKKEE